MYSTHVIIKHAFYINIDTLYNKKYFNYGSM